MLAQQFDKMHFGFDAAPAVISASASLDSPTEAFRAIAPRLSGFHGLAFLRGDMMGVAL